MTTLTPARGPFERAACSSANRGPARSGNGTAHLATLKRFCVTAATILAAGAALAAIMALKIAVYLPRFLHH